MGDSKTKWSSPPSSLERVGAVPQEPGGSRPSKSYLIAKEKRMRSLCEHTGSVYAICFWSSKDKGNMLVSGSMDGTIKSWSLDKGLSLHTMRGHADAVRCLAVSKHEHANPMIFSGGDDGRLMLWSLLTGKLLHTLSGHHGDILALAVCHDDRFPFVASAGRDKAIRLWNYNSGEFTFMLQGHEQAITSLEISAWGTPLLVSAGADRLVKVWDVASGRLIRRMEGHSGRITCLVMSKDPSAPTILVSADSAGAVIVWDLKHFKRLFFLMTPSESGLISAANENGAHSEGKLTGHAGEISSIALSFSCENLVIVTATWGGSVKVWDGRSGGLLRVFEGSIYSSVHRVAICYDAVSGLIAMACADGTVYLASPEDDYWDAGRSISSLHETSIEASLALVGKYITFVRLHEEVGAHRALVDSNNVILTIVFYCMIRFAVVNPSFFLANVDVTSSVLSRIIELVDLLFVDSFVGVTAMQFLLERRVCVGLAQDWIRIEKNQARVMAFLGDKLQSNDTLDCVLSALVTDSQEGWDLLVSHPNFPTIFENLMLHSPRSHSKLAYLITKFGLCVEREPFHIPLKVPADKEFTAIRFGQIEYDHRGVHCFRVRIQDRLQSEFYMTHKFLDALVRSESVEQLVGAPLVEYVLCYRWDTWGFYATVGLGLLHIVYCIAAMASVFCICSADYDECRLSLIHAISVSFVIFINTLYMGLLVLQYKMAPDKWAFFTNYWGIFEVIMVGMCHVCILLGTALGPIFIIRQLCAIFALMLWAWLPYFGRGSFGLASLIHQMRIIIWEVRYFVGILCLFNCAFAIAFRLLHIYDSIWTAAVRCFNMMLGDIHYDYFEEQTFAQILYMIFLISVAIILLNSLIAFMEGSLDSARKKEKIASKIARAQFLCELEVRLLPFNRLAAFFSSRSTDAPHEYLSPSAILVKDGEFGDDRDGKKGSRGGKHNELIILFPESFGMPPFDNEDDINDTNGFQKINLKTEAKANINKYPDIDIPDSYHERLGKIELQVNSLDKKMDLILSTLTRTNISGDLTVCKSKLSGQSVKLDDIFASSQSSTSINNLLDSSQLGGHTEIMESIQRFVPYSNDERAISPANTKWKDVPISYSYFGSAEEDADDSELI